MFHATAFRAERAAIFPKNTLRMNNRQLRYVHAHERDCPLFYLTVRCRMAFPIQHPGFELWPIARPAYDAVTFGQGFS